MGQNNEELQADSFGPVEISSPDPHEPTFLPSVSKVLISSSQNCEHKPEKGYQNASLLEAK
jgi:hypothetical protein